ncbi:MAG TPA: Spo0B domain-containing protein [Bacillota bacterium]|jgi:hypothetical protein
MNAPTPPAVWPAPVFVILGLVALGLALGIPIGLVLAKRRPSAGSSAAVRRDVERRVIALLRNRRHAFLNHLQVISGWLQLGNSARAGAYIDQVLQNMEKENRFIRAADPSLVAFLLTKEESARSRGLELEPSIEAGLAAAEEVAATIQPALEPVLDRVIQASPPTGGRLGLDLAGDETGFSATIEGPEDADQWLAGALESSAGVRVLRAAPRRWVVSWSKGPRRPL